MGAFKPWHIIVLVVVLVLLFGAKRLPDAARSLGRSLRIIKAETRGLRRGRRARPRRRPSRAAQPLTVAPTTSRRRWRDPVQRVRDD